jgi:hypothetical protein
MNSALIQLVERKHVPQLLPEGIPPRCTVWQIGEAYFVLRRIKRVELQSFEHRNLMMKAK